MHLNKVVIYGFKSFGKETQIVLPPGITALVGPNGGGKSNVVDAIRWALGEQKVRELRAERWDELLHAGGSGRPASRMAEVSLHFDNSDQKMASWPESLTVTRRYYRNGESEYLINGRSVRLRDVSDLFLDSGLGRFNYAIISQGRVEAALVQKPRERLEQLEEAAGVSRYKVRKRETLGHLQDVEANLARLEVLQAENERQMTALAQKAEQERQYLEWHRLQQDWQTRIQLTAYHRDQVRLTNAQKELSLSLTDLKAINHEVLSLDSQIETMRECVDVSQQAMAGSGEQLQQLELNVNNLAHQISERKMSLNSLSRERSRLMEELAALDKELDDVNQEAQSFEEHAVDPRTVALEERLRALQGEIFSLEQEISQHNQDTATHGQELLHIQERLEHIHRTMARWQGALGTDSSVSLSDIMEQKQLQERQLEAEVRQLSQELANVTEQRRKLQIFRTQTEQELAPLRHQLAGRQARLRALHQLEAEGEGLPVGVRAILRAQADQQLQGIRGTVGSLLESEPDVTMAVHTALGGSVADLIVDHELHARQAVKFLQAHALGRATFLPLDTIRPGLVPDADRVLNRLNGVVGWALDVVHFDRLLRPAMSHLLGRVLVVKTLDQAMEIGAHHRFRYKMVTLDGQLVHAGGAITGGHHGQRDSRNGRQTEMRTLSARIAQEVKIVEGKDELLAGTLQELGSMDIVLEGVRERLSDRRHQWTSLRGTLASLSEDTPRDLESNAKRLQEELEKGQIELERLNHKGLALNQRLGEIKNMRAAVQEQLGEDRAALGQRRLLRERVLKETERLSQQRQRLMASRDLIDSSLTEQSAELTELTQTHQDGLKQLEQQRSQVSDQRRAWDQLKQDELAAENRQRALQHEERRLLSRTTHWEQEIFKIEHQWTGFEPDAGHSPLTSQEEKQAQEELARIGAAISGLGDMAPGSLALYQQLKARSDYLTSQENDVAAAREDLLKTLGELDSEVNRRVEVTIHRIEQAFNDACRTLFSGGQGGVSWTSDPDAGLELWVRPSGKRPAHLGLLSGGEKALGGIAWLFALLSVKPSPFVVLDEVEASLDESNAARFAQYLQEFRRTTQCVIVTHQKATMEIADALWGVAGNGQGESRLVSVLMEEVSS